MGSQRDLVPGDRFLVTRTRLTDQDREVVRKEAKTPHSLFNARWVYGLVLATLIALIQLKFWFPDLSPILDPTPPGVRVDWGDLGPPPTLSPAQREKLAAESKPSPGSTLGPTLLVIAGQLGSFAAALWFLSLASPV